MEDGVKLMEKQLNKKFSDKSNPLLLSVRSGARESMPGMMDTILNLGLNDETVDALAESSGNPRFAWDSYRRFIQMYGDVVMGVQKLSEDEEPFELVIEKVKKNCSVMLTPRTRTSPPTTSRYSSVNSRNSSKAAPARRSRTIHGINSAARSVPSVHG